MVKNLAKTRLLERRISLRWIALGVVLLAAGILLALRLTKPSGKVATGGDVQRLAASLPSQSTNTVLHYTGSQTPPTNHWFTPLLTTFPTQPAYGYPLATTFSNEGLNIGVPIVDSQPDVVTAPFKAAFTIGLGDNFNSITATSYDALSVELKLGAGRKTIGSARLTHGSPFVFANFTKGQKLSLSAKGLTCKDQAELTVCSTASRDGVVYALVVPKKQWSKQVSPGTVTFESLTANNPVTAFSAPNNGDLSAYINASQHPIVKTTVSYQLSNGSYDTMLSLNTADNQPTIFGLLPHQADTRTTCTSDQYQTLYGMQTMCSGKSFSYKTNANTIPSQLDISRLTTTQKQQLKASLEKDTLLTTTQSQDTYFGGKEVYRIAQLYDLSMQLGDKDQSAALHDRLKQTITTWLQVDGKQVRSSKYFYYDPMLKTIVGAPNSFDAEHDSDHHFHYGYIISAAAILTRHDPSFLFTQNKTFVDALVEDITNANFTTSPDLNGLRYFDPYVGHSWASGLSKYSDGNNQESSSEAINAWYGIYLWGQVSNNPELSKQAAWLVSQESTSATDYWLKGPAAMNGSKYNHGIYSLVWGGKREFATFFSGSAAAKYGIQLLPLSPASSYLTANKPLAEQFLNGFQADSASQPADQFNDYFAMLEASVNPETALQKAQSLKDSQIDSANSRTYMLAWIFTKQNS